MSHRLLIPAGLIAACSALGWAAGSVELPANWSLLADHGDPKPSCSTGATPTATCCGTVKGRASLVTSTRPAARGLVLGAQECRPSEPIPQLVQPGDDPENQPRPRGRSMDRIDKADLRARNPSD